MLTEWGQGCAPSSGLVDECHAVMDMADEYLVSWIDWYWQGELFSKYANSQPSNANCLLFCIVDGSQATRPLLYTPVPLPKL